jgi:hypothetical protein
MENILGIIGTITGVLGLFLAVFIAIRQVQAEKMQAKELEIQKQEQARNNRLMFLADRIFDSSIPRELRQPFYEEYISMKGNGTAVRFWLLEGEREKKTQQLT